MRALLEHRWFYLLVSLFLVADLYLSYQGKYFLNAAPFALILIYSAIYHLDKLFLFVVFCTPLSVNIEEFVTADLGLFLPTEPILFGILLLIIFKQFKENLFEREFFRHPITILLVFHLLWILMTCLTSELPLVSFKYFLMKLWFIIPIYFLGYLVFKEEKNMFRFAWFFVAALTVVVLYTLVNHAANGFDEESGHWVMWPFFKDHTSYGAILALVYPLFFIFLLGRKNNPLIRITLISLIILFGFAIIMSYTRAAWGSLVAALAVYLCIRFKIKFKYLFSLGLVAAIYVAMSWVSIQHNLERNRAEHATENLDERVESMANIATDASNLERFNRWGSAIRMWQERPILGWGPGTYAMIYGPFQLSSGLTIISTNSGNMGNAHSEYLGPLAEQGLPGMLLMLTIVGFLMYYSITVYLRMPDGDLKLLLMAVILGLVTYFLHGAFNNYLDTDKASIPIWGFTAIIVALDLKFPKEKKSTSVQR